MKFHEDSFNRNKAEGDTMFKCFSEKCVAFSMEYLNGLMVNVGIHAL